MATESDSGLNQQLAESCRDGALQRVAALLDSGTAVNAVDADGRTPLHVALHTSTIEQLLLHGADPDLAKGREGAAAWHR